ncbi:MAG: two-component system OmpR family alkaline phosphatase synthesis response regulator PhoP [Bacteroidetes bacterium]|nr:MAG: two-component system OmpR family alkaline phosphatase synthesis response regulator PhoP [Bacteroidota bacterium]
METQNASILLVDDEPDILEFLSYNLQKEGYNVFRASNGNDAMKIARKVRPNLIILDVMMPQPDGYEICREIRRDEHLKDSVVAFLSAKSEEVSQIEGFKVGADDFIGKPVKPKVFLFRVQALLRRQGGEKEPLNRVFFEDLMIDKESYTVVKRGVTIELSKKEFELLILLTSRPGKVFTRDEIFRKIWGPDVIVGERTIDVHIRKLREKIGLGNIKTIKGVGYYFS